MYHHAVPATDASSGAYAWQGEEPPIAPPLPVAPDYGNSMEGGSSSSSSRRLEGDDTQADLHMKGLLHWLRDESFMAELAEWSWDNCIDFPRDSASLTCTEHSLRFTEAHLEYRHLFESRAEQYLHYYGLEVEVFLQLAVQYLDCQNSADADDDVFEGLVASESYPTFFVYMCTVRRRRELAERSMGGRDEIDWSELMRGAIRRNLGDVTVGDDSDIEHLE
eukprot:TRINITY_DN5569_c3_g1_i1.p1 TRINITY_DN5569_c3_g1~~TRINITY_DN5569_c3_g1_i1.p1  ORF type:complete len:221 (+),score=50.40 TRINITY_DN5569_c3_g1_i1:17-679(+)